MPETTRRTGPAAVALRLAGASFNDIAEALGVADAHAARLMVEETLAVTAVDPQTREMMRAEMNLRLERLLRGVWAKATNPDHPEHIPSGKFALAVADRLIRLNGLDAPAEIVVHTPTMSEIDQWVASVTAEQVRALRELEDTIVDGEVVEDATAS